MKHSPKFLFIAISRMGSGNIASSASWDKLVLYKLYSKLNILLMVCLWNLILFFFLKTLNSNYVPSADKLFHLSRLPAEYNGACLMHCISYVIKLVSAELKSDFGYWVLCILLMSDEICQLFNLSSVLGAELTSVETTWRKEAEASSFHPADNLSWELSPPPKWSIVQRFNSHNFPTHLLWGGGEDTCMNRLCANKCSYEGLGSHGKSSAWWMTYFSTPSHS